MLSPKENIPTIMIVLGATGDLMARKISPALFHLFEKNKLPELFSLVGYARRDLSRKDFQTHVERNIKKHGEISKKTNLNKFLRKASYQQGDLNQKEDYGNLAKLVQEIDDSWGVCSNKLFYLAIPPELYEGTFKNLSSSGLTNPCSPEEGWTRVLVEKPFGKNLKTAKELDSLLGKLFREEQIYRIDHYLNKEMLQNILSFRFSNNLFEQAWDNKSIEKIEISLLETLGVEKRGGFYDGLGALRDVGQNHLLQMLAFATMDHPGNFDPKSIREKRAEILKTLIISTEKKAAEMSYRAQYKGFKDIKDVKRGSKTETYFKVGAFLSHPRWQGVPIIMESGKRMGSIRKEVTLTFKHPSPCLCPPRSNHYKNKVTFSIEPMEGIKIIFWNKKPGFKYEIEEREFNMELRDSSGRKQYVEEYEKLLLDCISGDQTSFISTDEVTAMWKYIDPIISAWEKNLVSLNRYRPNTEEPTNNSMYLNDKLIASTKIKSSPITDKREIGIIGLGKMGGNIARRLMKKGWEVVGYNRSDSPTKKLEKEGLIGEYSPKKLVARLKHPRIIWLMVPAGKAIDGVLFGKDGIVGELSRGDIIIDGGNSYFKDSVRRYKRLKQSGINFVDVGVSGGPSGALNGSTIMVGGEKEISFELEQLFFDLTQENGYEIFGEPGSGHFVKMIHNGIEYGIMQSIAEGFNILKNSSYKLNLANIARVYNEGSVIESRLMGWLYNAFQIHGENLSKVSGTVGHTGEGAWTVKTAKEIKVKAEVIENALNFRKMSEKDPSYMGKILSALREQFGGHSINIKKKQ